MPNLTVRRSSGNPAPLAPVAREIDPFRMMRDWMRFDPFQEIAPLFSTEARAGVYAPTFDVKETKDAYVFKADVPAVKEADLDITITGNRLSISGKRENEKVEEHDNYYACECSYGSFSRSFTLPDGIDTDHIHADLKAGVLTVAVPKLPETKAKKVEVKTTKQ